MPPAAPVASTALNVLDELYLHLDRATRSRGADGGSPAPDGESSAAGDAGDVLVLNLHHAAGDGLGVAALNGRMHLTLRYRHALFGPEAAAEFLQLFREVLLSGP